MATIKQLFKETKVQATTDATSTVIKTFSPPTASIWVVKILVEAKVLGTDVGGYWEYSRSFTRAAGDISAGALQSLVVSPIPTALVLLQRDEVAPTTSEVRVVGIALTDINWLAWIWTYMWTPA